VDGWVLVGSPPVAPYVEVVGVDQPWSPRRVEVRLIAGPSGLCLDGLSAEGDRPPLPARTGAPPALPRRTVPMNAFDADQPGSRTLLRCSG
jgi:hypothetical protein